MSRPELLYTHFPHCPMPVRVGLLRWRWTIRDSATGPVIAKGATRTEWGAIRRRERIRAACMRRQHVVNIDHPPLHPMSKPEADAAMQELATEGVRVQVRPLRDGNAVELCPLGRLSTWDRVAAMRAVNLRTDAPMRWTRAVPQ